MQRHVDAEMPVLGAMMLDASVARRATDGLKAEQFLNQAHREVFQAIRQIVVAGGEVDGKSLSIALEVGRVGGENYLIQLAESCVTARNYPWYRDQMLKNWRMREVKRRSQEACAAVDAEDYESAMGYVNRFGQGLTDDATKVYDVSQVVDSIRSKAGTGKRGIPTGISKWDECCIDGFGLRAGHTTILAAAEGVGKSYLSTQVVCNACESGLRVAYGSFELDREELVERMARQITGLRDYAHAQYLDRAEEWEWALRKIELWDLVIYDDALSADDGQYVEDFVQFVRAEHEHKPLDLVGCDYLQLLDTRRKAHEERLVIKACSRVMRAEAKRSGVPWLVVAQAEVPEPSKESKKPWPYIRGGKEPQKDAAMVLFLIEQDGGYSLKCIKNRYHANITLPYTTERLPRRWSRSVALNEPYMVFGGVA